MLCSLQFGLLKVSQSRTSIEMHYCSETRSVSERVRHVTFRGQAVVRDPPSERDYRRPGAGLSAHACKTAFSKTIETRNKMNLPVALIQRTTQSTAIITIIVSLLWHNNSSQKHRFGAANPQLYT